MFRLQGSADGRRMVSMKVDGRDIEAYEGDSVATAMLASGLRVFRRTRQGDVRAPFCNMGTCFECLVTLGGARSVRACMTAVAAGMAVTRDLGA